MNRAVMSVLFNISEGFVRRRDRETRQFLRYAMSSNGELKAGFYAGEGRGYLTRNEMPPLIERKEYIAKMLRRWYATLNGGTKD